MANSAAIIGAPTVSNVTEDTNLQTLIAAGMISISDANAGQAAFKTTVISASGNLGTLTIAANGAYSYRVADSAVQYLGAGDIKIDTFTVTSLDGTTRKVDFTIHGVNDAAVIGNVTASVVTEDKTRTTLTTSGKISISDVDQGEASFNTAVTSAAGNLGTLTLSSNGSYSYSAANSSAQYLGAGDTKIDTFTVTASDGTTKQLSFTIKGVNDTAVIGAPTVRDVTEDASNPNLIASGLISISDADQGEAAFKTAVISASGNLGTLTLAANGSYSYSVANNAAQYLGAGDTKTDTFTVTSLDGTAKQVSFTIHGKNDAAVIGIPTVHDVTEDATRPFLYALGTISISDADQGEAAFRTALICGPGTLGTLVLLSNGSYGYFVSNSAVQYLGANDTKIDTFTVTAADGTTQQVSFTIHGTNDVAVIGTPTVHDVTEDFSATTLTATGSISISDADQGQAAFNTSVTSAGSNLGTLTLAANGTYSYSVANSATQFLGANDVKTDTFTIKSADGTTKQVAFTIHGKNDAAVIGTPTVNEVTADPNAVTLTATGSISISDVDQGQASFKPNVISAAGNFGLLALASDGTYSYTVAESVAAQLGTSGTKVDTFTVTSLDGTTQQITFTVHGTGSGNHVAEIGGVSTGSVTEDVAVAPGNLLQTSGALTITDADAGQSSFVAQASKAGAYGAFTLAADGAWTYAANDGQSAIQQLGEGQSLTDSFTAVSSDGSASTLVTVTINGTNDAPVAGSPVVVVRSEGDPGLGVDLLLGAHDVDNGDSVHVANVSPLPAGITLTSHYLGVDASDAAYDSLAQGESVHIAVDYDVADNFGGLTHQQADITINGTNDAPVSGADQTVSTTEGASPISFNLLSGASDVDHGAVLHAVNITPGVPGVTVNGDSIAFDPGAAAFQQLAQGDQAVITVAYDVQDQFGAYAINHSFVNITVNGVNDAPGAAVFTPASSTAIPEGSAIGTVVGTVVGTDIDGPIGVLTYSLVDEDGSPYTGPLAIDAHSGVVTVSGDIDFESTGGVLAATVRTTDQGGLHGDTAFAVTIGDELDVDMSAIEGYVANATIFVDDDNSGDLSAGDFVTHSDSVGAFHITGTHTGTIYLVGGGDAVDTATGLPFEGILRAAPGSTVLSPLTTLIAAIAATNGGNVSAATDQVVEALGLVLPVGVDLNTFDPIAAALSDNPADQAAGEQLFAAGVQVYNTIVQAASLITGSGATAESAASAVLGAIVTQITTTTGEVSLSNSTTLEDVITAAATTAGTDVSQTAAGAASIISGSNTLIDVAVLNSSGTGLDLLQAVAGNAAVAQGAAAEALVQAGVNNDVADAEAAFTSTNLQTAVGAATAIIDTNALAGPAGDNTIVGTSGADTLDGGGGNDTLSGLDGKDLLIGGTGDDLLDGGQGFDRADYTEATGGVTINLVAGTASGSGVGSDTLVNIEGAVGSDFADTFNATGFAGTTGVPGGTIGFNQFEGRGGDDLIIGDINAQGQILTRVSYVGATNAVTVDIAAGTADGDVSVGHDTFSNVSAVFGSAFNDTLIGSDNAFATFEAYEGRGGDDLIDGRGGYDIVTYNTDTTTTSGINVQLAVGTVTGDATVGTDTIRNVEAIRGTNFHDVYNAIGYGLAGALNVSTTNGSFNDFGGAGGDDTVIGNGNTRLNYSQATASVAVNLEISAIGTTNAITVVGTASGASEGTDSLTGVNSVQASTFSDTLLGSSFNNTFTGLGGDDFIDGRGGFDVASYNSLGLGTGGVSVNMAAGTAAGDASIGTDTLRNVEGIQGTNFADTYVATGYGVAGASNVSTSNGNFNQFEGLGGDDSITGNGNTRLGYFNTTSGVTINLQAGSATGDASVGTDTFVGVNSATGGNFADVFNAAGFDGVSAAGSFGTFNGFQGQGGDDTVNGNGNTQIQFNNATAGVTINLQAGTAVGDASVGNDTFNGVNNVQGSNFGDTYNAAGFTGVSAAGSFGTFNSFQGNGGNDIITGNNNTSIQFGSATAGVIVNLAAGTASGDASVGNDTITGGVFNVQGSNFNDTITGSNANDFLGGANGNDAIAGGGGNDSINGGNGTDTAVFTGALAAYTITALGNGQYQVTDSVAGRDGSDNLTGIENLQFSDGTFAATSLAGGLTLNGDANGNTLVGSAASDTINGLGGNDRLQGLGGNDLLDGGADFDRAVYSDATGGVTINLAAGTASGPGVGTDTLINIEGAVGSDFADTYTAAGFMGNSGVIGTPISFNEFEGRGGNDSITGMINTSGQILGRTSYVSATGAVTVDFATGTADGDLSVGHDTLTNINLAIGSIYADTFHGSDNGFGTFEQYDGRAGDDLIDGRGGYDFAVYNLDSSTTTGISANLAAGTVTGDASIGTDTLRSVEAVRGTNFVDTFNATGFSGSSTNAGSSGTFNNFEGLGGNDSIIGNGSTRIQYTNSLDAITVDIALGTAHGTAAGDVANVGTDTFSGVNAVMASMFDDTLLGSGANENFMGMAGNDFIDGRGGFDVALYSNLTFTTGGVNIDMTAGIVTGDASIGTDTLRSIEGTQGTFFADTYSAVGFGGGANIGNNGTFNQFEGLNGNDTITGNGNTRLIYASSTGAVTIDLVAGTATGDASIGTDTFTGVNAVTGSAFNDQISGSSFNDNFTGLAGDDFIDGLGGIDSASYNASNVTGGISVNLLAGTVIGDASIGTDTLRSIESIQGTNFDDVFVATNFGTPGANMGSNGTFNIFQGNGGNDSITGNGNTQIQYNNATGGVTVDLAAGTASGDASVGIDSLFGGISQVQGSNFDDTLQGSSASEFFNGNGGNDTITGRGGNDSMTGGTGADTFVYATGDGSDFINDFNRGQGDRIDVTGVHGVSSFADIQSVASQQGANTYLDFGAGQGITLQNLSVASLVASDFVFNPNSPSIIINGDANDNNLNGGPLSETINGNDGNDQLFGSGGNDILNGGNGSDVLTGGAGNDILDGGANNQGDLDQAVYYTSPGAVVVNLATGTASDGYGGTDTLIGIEYVNGSIYNDTLIGSAAGGEMLEGNAGNDTIDGGGSSGQPFGDWVNYVNFSTSGVVVNLSASTIAGVAANTATDGLGGVDTLSNIDSVIGSHYDDIVAGNANDNFLRGYQGADVIYGGAGNDVIYGAEQNHPEYGGNDSLYGDGGNDQIFGGSDNDLIDGGADNDTLTGSAGADTFVYAAGGGGFDTITDFNHGEGDRIDLTSFAPGATGIYSLSDVVAISTQSGANTVIDFGGGNTLTLNNVTLANLTGSDFVFGTPAPIVGDANNNTLVGTSVDDTIQGLVGNDRMQGRAGNDLLDGGLGFDRAIYTDATGAITVDLTAGTVTGAGVGSDTLSSVEGIVGSDFADTFNATGFAGVSGIPGVTIGLNEFEGRGGDDLVIGQINAQGQVTTRLSYLNATAAVMVDLSAGTADGDASVGHDTVSNISGIFGSAYNDTFYGRDNGFFTFETYEGRGGDDYIDGRGGFDQLTYNNDPTTTSGITVHLAAGTVTGDATVGTDTMRNVEAVRGTNFDDVFDATGYGLAGALNVSTTNGTFNDFGGQGGNDTIIGNGNTRLNFAIAAASVTVDLETSVGTAITVAGSATGATEGTDTFTGVNAVQGSSFGDTLLGSSFNNTLTGLGGNDYLDGRGGFDTASFNSLGTATGGVTVSFAAGTVTGDASIGTDTLRNIEGVQGTMFADTFDATGYGQAGAQNVSTSNGNFNQFEGLGGDDTITGNANTRVLYSSSTDGVTITIGAGGAGSAHGTAGGDTATVGNDSFTGGVNSAIGSNFADIYNASAFNGGFNSFQGNGGNDTITGNGSTQVVYGNATSGVTVDLASGNVNGDASVGHDTITGGVNNVFGSNFNDTIAGSIINDFLSGSGGNDTIISGGGSDTLNGGAGADTFAFATGGGASVVQDFSHGQGDLIDLHGIAGVSNFSDVQSHATQVGPNAFIDFGGGNTLTLNNVTSSNLVASDFVFHNANGGLILTGDGNDNTLIGGAGPDSISGNDGSDNLIGNGGDDVITGGNGQDFLRGGSGNDFLDGGANIQGYSDMAQYSDAPTGVVVNLGTGIASDGFGGTDTLVNIETVGGSAFNDVLTGSAADNELFDGGAGNDTIDGGGKSIASGPFGDFSNYAGATGGIVVDLVAGTAIGNASIGNDTLINIDSINGSAFNDVITGNSNANLLRGFDGTDVIHGGDGNDQIEGGQLSNPALGGNDSLYGDGGNDVIYGGSGNDLLDGGADNDTMIGSTGADTFIYASGGGNDTIADFNHGEGDRINVVGVTGLYTLGQIQAQSTQNGTDTVISFDGVNSLTLSNTAIGSLTASDFVFAPNSAPTDILLSSNTVAENSAAGTPVGLLSDLDPDAGDTATYTLIADAGGRFGISNGQIVVAGALDYETATSHQITVRVTDIVGNTFDKDLTINVTDVSESGSTIVGTAAGETLPGTPSDDLIQGLAGNDRLQGFAGNDTLDGGTGFDRALYTDASGGITVNLAAGTVSGAGVDSDTLIGVEAVVGSAFADTYDPTGFAGDTFVAGTNIGLNEFEGRGGDDTITSAVNSQGALLTRISYANAASSVTVDLTAHTASGGDGNDTLIGSGFAGVIGSGFDDQLLGSTNAGGTVEVFEGRAGNDFINGRAGFDRADYALDPAAVGGINVQLAAGTVTGDATTVGTDTLRSVESVRGSNAADTFNATGFGTGSTNAGSNGTFNEFVGMGGNDTITGNGNTRVAFTSATGAVQVDLQTDTTIGTIGTTVGKGIATGDTSTGTDTFTGVNAVMASMFDDTLYGSNNTGATETFAGLAGNDFINGRGGFDIVSYNNIYFSTGAVTIDFTLGTATGDASIGSDTFRGIEGAQGTNFNDFFVATNFGTALYSNASLYNVGNAGFGNYNQFEGLGGNDTITGNGNTRILFNSATSGVTINMQAGTATGASTGSDTFVGVNSATGSNSVDTYNAAAFTGITSAGSFGNYNQFEGLGGNDIITGNGNTRIVYAAAAAAVTVDLSAGTASGTLAGDSANVGTDNITGGVNSVQGSGFDDTITGSTANESFLGGGGGDTINAGGGNDGITGQGGSDTIDGGAGTDMVSFTGVQANYTVSANTPGAGQTQVLNIGNANGDGTDILSNVEVLQFSNAIVLLSAGTSGSPIDISTQQLNANLTVTGTGSDDYLAVGGNIVGHQINLGAGSNDTVIVSSGATLNLVGVEYVSGTSGDNFAGLVNNANGLVVDLGAGTNDGLGLAAGTNTLSITGVESVNGTDFGATPGVDDVLNLLNNVSGINISLGNGNNTMQLAVGPNSFVNIWDINHVNGTTGDDTLTVTGALSAGNGSVVDLGAGDDTFVLSGNFASFAAVGIEHFSGSATDNQLLLSNNVTNVDINLGGGTNDTVGLANGFNSLSITGVENLNASDWSGTPSDDTITLLNDVSGVTVNMAQGTANVLNLAAGSNSFDNLWNVNLVNGSASDDTLTLVGTAANVIDMGDGNDTVNLGLSVNSTIANTETINGTSNFDVITLSNTATGNATITAGAGSDVITASAGHDNFRFASTADSAAGAADTINNFDAANDSFTFSGIAIGGGHIEYVDTGALLNNGQASAHLQNNGPGNDYLQIDTNGDGFSDMDISLQNFTGTLSNSNFLLS